MKKQSVIPMCRSVPDEYGTAHSHMRYRWDAQVVLKCCRYWLSHGYARGKCGICNETAELTDLTWEQALLARITETENI